MQLFLTDSGMSRIQKETKEQLRVISGRCLRINTAIVRRNYSSNCMHRQWNEAVIANRRRPIERPSHHFLPQSIDNADHYSCKPLPCPRKNFPMCNGQRVSIEIPSSREFRQSLTLGVCLHGKQHGNVHRHEQTCCLGKNVRAYIEDISGA